MKQFEIYFNDLNEEAQKELLELINCKDSSEMNWDSNLVPLAIIDLEDEDEDEDEDDINRYIEVK